MHQNLFKLTSIVMSNLKAVCWTNTYQFLLCSCLTWRQVALCESFLNLHLQRVAIHNYHVLLTSLSQDYLYFLPLFKRTKMQILVAPCLLIPPTHELLGDSSVKACALWFLPPFWSTYNDKIGGRSSTRRWKSCCGKCRHSPRCVERISDAWLCWCHESAGNKQSAADSSLAALTLSYRRRNN